MIALSDPHSVTTSPATAPAAALVRPLGVSLVVCTHDGESRLPGTLARIAAQRVSSTIPWEVIVVDNASNDRTSAAAAASWPAAAPVPLRIVVESRPGLTHARRRGVAVSRFEYISFLDDDNWPAADWVETAFELMSRRPQVGGAGSRNDPRLDGDEPEWFSEFSGVFAVGEQGSPGDVTDTRSLLWGAGLTLRHAAWQDLERHGFEFHSTDRIGNALTSGGDSELCLALRLRGWRLWYEPGLRLQHVIAPHRLDWSTLLRTVRASGQATVHHDPYYLRLMPERLTDRLRLLRWSWPWQAGAAACAALRAGLRERSAADESARRSAEVARTAALGRMEALVRHRRVYTRSVRAVLAEPPHSRRP
jgi:GT2 family glycosyltransferase